VPVTDTQESLLSLIWQCLLAQSGWEWLASGLGVAYIYLAAKESTWCWPAAFVSTLIYTILFWQGQLPMQAALNFYYLVMAVYGFWSWQKPTQPCDALTPSFLSFKGHLLFLSLGIISTFAIAEYLTQSHQSAYPLLDAFVSIFAVLNTYLMVKKYIDNWLYWLIINSAGIYLYWLSEFYVTILLFSIYQFMAIYGFLQWRRTLHSK
jgi:nicotinamide mononucleotide transporter